MAPSQPRPSCEGPTKALVNSSVSALEHKVDGRIDQLEARLEARLKTVEGQAQSQTQRLDEMDNRLFFSSKDIQGLSSQLQEGLEKVMGMIGLQPSKRILRMSHLASGQRLPDVPLSLVRCQLQSGAYQRRRLA